MVAMGSKIINVARKQLELPRHITVPILLFVLLTIPWLFGGRDPIGHLLAAGLSLLLFLSWLLMSRHRALRVDIRPVYVVAPLAVLVAWSTVSLFWTASLFQSLALLTTMFEAALAFVVARDVLHEEEAPYFFTRLWLSTAFVVWAIGLIMFVGGNYDRMTSLFYWANPLGTYLAASLVVGLSVVRSSSGRAARGWLLVCAALTSGLILTYSRSAWLVAILAIAVTIILSKDRRAEYIRLFKILLIGCILALGSAMVRGTVYKKPVIDVRSRVAESANSRSVSDRFLFWQEASVLFSERPLIGWGVGTYSEVHPRVQVSATTAGNNPHNSFLQSLVELGAVGAIAYIVLIGGWVQVGWRLFKDGDDGIAPVAWLVVSVITLHSWLDLTSNYPVLVLAGAIWMAIALPAPKKEFRLKLWYTAMPLVAVGSVLVWTLWANWNVYVSSVEIQAANLSLAEDPSSPEAAYAQIVERPIVDPDYISQAVVSYIDRFDSQKGAPAESLEPARKYAEQAVRLEPQDARHVFALANVLERQGKVIDALTNYRAAIMLDPHNNPQYYTAYARLLQKEGQVTEAIVIMRTILDEYTPDVIENRAQVSISQRLAVGYALLADLNIEKEDLGKAQQAIDRAEALSPNNAFVQQVKATLQAAQE